MTPWHPSAIAHAHACYPRESCGVIVVARGREVYVPCENIASSADHFTINPYDYAAAEWKGEIVAIVHSHPNISPAPSEADRVSCEATGLPWHIVSFPAVAWATIQPSGYEAPLIGREWSHGVLDCYSLLRDWYRRERGVTLPDGPRADGWWKAGANIYMDGYAGAGFRRAAISDDKLEHEFMIGDVLLMQIASPVPNHAAIWVGDGMILQHLSGRLSSRDRFGGYFRKHTVHVLRHRTA